MKIGLDVSAVPARPAGAGRYILELAKGLTARSELTATLLARKSDSLRWEGFASADSVLAVAPNSRPARLAWEQTVLPQLLRKHHVDVQHSPHYTMPERASTPVVVTIHDLSVFDHPEWHERSKVMVFRRAITRAVKRADALIAVSRDTAQRLEDRFGIENVIVIPHGIDHQRFHAERTPTEREALSDAGIPNNYIVAVGTIEPRKNITQLVRVFDTLADDHDDLHLVIAGQRGWHLEEFDAALAAAKYRDRIVVTGYIDDALLAPLLRHAAVAAYPSQLEGFGLPALEALACGTALVAAKGSAVEEITGGAGVLVDPGDEAALLRGLQNALKSDSESQRQQRIDVAAGYSWHTVVDRHIEVYRSVVER